MLDATPRAPKALRYLLVAVLCFMEVSPAHAVKARVTVTSPTDYQVVQRTGANRANIVVAGTYTGNPRAIQARWRGGPWMTIDKSLTRTKGRFRGVLVNQRTGQGSLQVRFANLRGLIDTVRFVGVGDVIVIAGQSNAVGRGTSNHQYTPTHVRAALFGNNDRWRELRDPYDSPVGQVDRVSLDAFPNMGSWVAVFVNGYIRRTGVPVAIVPAARAASKIEQWAPSTSPTRLYGSMRRRVNAIGGRAKAVLWLQGENNSNMSSDSYRQQLNRLADRAFADFGAVTYPALIGSAPYPGVHRAGQRMGTLAAIAENPHILMGPALYDVDIEDEAGDGFHFMSNHDLVVIGTRFLYAVVGAQGPQLQRGSVSCRQVRLEFTPLGAVTANPESVWVLAGETRIAVESMTVEGDALVATLATAPDGPVTVSMGHDNRSGIDHAVYDSRGLPALPFRDIPAEVSGCAAEPGPSETPEPDPSETPEPESAPSETPEPEPTTSETPTPEPTGSATPESPSAG